MNKKKAFIPIVAIGALLLSLLVVFPAFGQGTPSFIDPDAIKDANDGSLSDSSPDEQAYGRQGGNIGLYLVDSDLNVPVRRVVIPGLDTTLVDDSVGTAAHSDEVMVNVDMATSYTTTTSGDNTVVDKHTQAITSKLKAGDYVMIGENTVRKVSEVTPATSTASTSEVWYLRRPNNDDSDTTLDDSIDLAKLSTPLPGVDFSGFTAGKAMTITVGVVSTGPGGSTALPSSLQLRTGEAEGTNLTQRNGTTTYTDDNAPGASFTINAAGTIGVAATETGKHVVTFTARQTAAQSGRSDLHEVEKKLTIHIIDDVAGGHFHPAMDTVELDRPFAVTEEAQELHTIKSAFYNVGSAGGAASSANWPSSYGMYAKAVKLTTATSTGGGFFRSRVDDLVADSGIGASVLASPTPEPADHGDAADRLTSATDDRINREDAIIVRVTDSTGVVDSDPLHAVDDVSDDKVFFSTNLDTESDAVTTYLAAWFHEKNDTGGTVTVRSSQLDAATVVMRETTADSGKFALKLLTVEYDGTAAEDSTSRVLDPAQDIPTLPVEPLDTVTFATSDSSTSLEIESDSPRISGLSPAHNYSGRSSRPEVSAQVTDDRSGIDDDNIHILFWIDEKDRTANSAVAVTPKTDGDVDQISGGYEVTAQMTGADAPKKDASIYWWVMATDDAGNVAFSDREPTKKDDTDDSCTVKALSKDGATLAAKLRSTAKALYEAKEKCDAHVIKVDGTVPKMERAETGRHWDPSLEILGDSKDYTEYRVSKADKASVLVIFNEALDLTSVSASDFEVASATPVDAVAYNVKIRDDSAGGDSGNVKLAGTQFAKAGDSKGYVFLTLASDLKPGATPKVELIGAVFDKANNELDSAKINNAVDRIAPTLTVTIDEGTRPVTRDKINLRITADETIGAPDVKVYHVISNGNQAMVVADDSPPTGQVTPVSRTEYTAVISDTNISPDGLYSIVVTANDSAIGGNNSGMAGDGSGEIEVDEDTKAILFEVDNVISDIDVDYDKPGFNDSFKIDDPNTYIRIDFEREGFEYDRKTRNNVQGDDLDTHASVTIVSATLNGDDITNDLQSDENGNVYLYKASDLALGKHELLVVAMDEAGNKHTSPEKATIEIIERKPFNLKLNPGWNLVSIPGEPADSDINVVIPADRTDISSVLSYDPTVPGMWLSASRGADGMFAGTLKNITASRAYWVQTTSFKAIKVSIPKQSAGTARILPTIEVAKGWNMVPILDVDGDFKFYPNATPPYDVRKSAHNYTWYDANDNARQAKGYFDGLEDARAYTFNTITNKWVLVSEVEIGKGYWLYVPKAGVIVP